MGKDSRFGKIIEFASKDDGYKRGAWVWTCKICVKKIKGSHSRVAEHFLIGEVDVEGVKRTTNVAKCPEGKNDELRSKAIKYVRETLANAKKLKASSESGSRQEGSGSRHKLAEDAGHVVVSFPH
jgi:hypothetical protein